MRFLPREASRRGLSSLLRSSPRAFSRTSWPASFRRRSFSSSPRLESASLNFRQANSCAVTAWAFPNADFKKVSLLLSYRDQSFPLQRLHPKPVVFNDLDLNCRQLRKIKLSRQGIAPLPCKLPVVLGAGFSRSIHQDLNVQVEWPAATGAQMKKLLGGGSAREPVTALTAMTR